MVYVSREKSGCNRIVAGSRCNWRITVSAGRQIAPGKQVVSEQSLAAADSDVLTDVLN